MTTTKDIIYSCVFGAALGAFLASVYLIRIGEFFTTGGL